jgi:hypothetical protein
MQAAAGCWNSLHVAPGAVPHHLMIPTYLLQWLSYRSTCTDGRFFKMRDNVIHFNIDIIEKTFRFTNGTIPFTMGQNYPDIEMIEVEALRRPYRVGNKFPIQKLESVLLGF